MNDTTITRLGRGSGDRQATLSQPLIELHRAILAHFVTAGAAPTFGWASMAALRLGLAAGALAELSAADLVHWNGEQVSVAYPFSGVPTAHRVSLADTPTVFAMCAVDALGMPAMAGRDGVITSADPQNDVPIRVERAGDEWHWDPVDTVVVVASTRHMEASFCCACPYVNFHADAESALAYLAAHKELDGDIVAQADAIAAGERIFGQLLST